MLTVGEVLVAALEIIALVVLGVLVFCVWLTRGQDG